MKPLARALVSAVVITGLAAFAQGKTAPAQQPEKKKPVVEEKRKEKPPTPKAGESAAPSEDAEVVKNLDLLEQMEDVQDLEFVEELNGDDSK